MPYCATRPTLARTASRTSSTTSTGASWSVWPRRTTIHSAPHANRHRGGASRRTCSPVVRLHGRSWNAGGLRPSFPSLAGGGVSGVPRGVARISPCSNPPGDLQPLRAEGGLGRESHRNSYVVDHITGLILLVYL